MRYGSVCSGIEAATVAWEPLGWNPAWFSEIAPFPSAVLKHHYPNVENLGDFTQIGPDRGPVDVLVGGTPCQSFSVAGRRAGLGDPRGVLAFEFLRLVDRLRPRWVLFENVPGLLSSNKGRDFGAWLRDLGNLGYGWAYRVLDAKHFGVPQRRRRVFVVGHLGDWRRAAAVLLEPSCLRGDFAPIREEEGSVASSLTRGAESGGRQRKNGDPTTDNYVTAFHVTQDPVNGDVAPTMGVGNPQGCGTIGVCVAAGVRRLTPRECERLQGFPDDYTLVPYNGKPAKDGPRYQALGNSMAVPVIRWIGERIQKVEEVVCETP